MGRYSWNLYPGDSVMMAVRTVFNLFCDSWQLYRKYIAKALNEDDLDGFINAYLKALANGELKE